MIVGMTPVETAKVTAIKMREEKKPKEDLTEEEIAAVMEEMTEFQRKYVMEVTEDEREKELRRWVVENRRIKELTNLLPHLNNWGSLPVPGASTCECRYLATGRSYFVFELVFPENAIACVARVSRELHQPAKLLSEVETVQLIRHHTCIHVPEVYLCETDTNNLLGAQYMLVERMDGKQLSELWETMSLAERKSIMKQMAKFLIDLSVLKFDKIGWFRQDRHQVGPFLHMVTNNFAGPFSDALDYFKSYVPSQSPNCSTLLAILETYFLEPLEPSALSPPFQLIHPDLQQWNILITRSPEPVISAFLDWEYVQTGPRYLFYEYPPFIQSNDSSMEGESLPTNAILREHFRTELLGLCSSEEQRKDVEACMNKSYILNGFNWNVVGGSAMGTELHEMFISMYVRRYEDRSGRSYAFEYPPGEAELTDEEEGSEVWEEESGDYESGEDESSDFYGSSHSEPDQESADTYFTDDTDATLISGEELKHGYEIEPISDGIIDKFATLMGTTSTFEIV